MHWTTDQKSSFSLEQLDLPKNLQKQVIRAIEELRDAPDQTRGNTIKPLTGDLGGQGLWRYRIGDHRMIYRPYPKSKRIELLAIGPRDAVYKRFKPPAPTEDIPAAAENAPSQPQNTPPAFDPNWTKPTSADADPLPKKLTPALLTRWQIGEQHFGTLVRCHSEDELMDADVPESVKQALLDLLFPPTIEELDKRPNYALIDPEDLNRFAEGTLRTFLLALDDSQKPLTDWAIKGPTLVKGGPGSGKSTVALYRIRAIVEHHLKTTGNFPRILFTTYTNALIKYSESLILQLIRHLLPDGQKETLPKSIKVSTIDSIALHYAYTKNAGTQFKPDFGPQQKGLIQTIRLAFNQPNLAHLRDDYLFEEFSWVIEGQGCKTEADYLAAERTGRGIPLSKNQRSAVWTLYTTMISQLNTQGYRSNGQFTMDALEWVESSKFNDHYDYVIVDEAQDLRPTSLALCLQLAKSPAGLFLTADANQSLYNSGFSWNKVHADFKVTGRTRILRRNYRTTAEIANAAHNILQGDSMLDKGVADQECVHTGNPPTIYAATGSSDQIGWIAQQIYHAAQDMRLPLNAAAVLVHSSSIGKSVAAELQNRGLPAKFVASKDLEIKDRVLKVTTLHAAKGLEFPIVAIAHVEAGRLPKETQACDPAELDEHIRNQRRLFYVGCTRAMRHLFITHDKALPSPFLNDLQDHHWLRFEN